MIQLPSETQYNETHMCPAIFIVCQVKTLAEALSALEDSQGGLADEVWPLESCGMSQWTLVASPKLPHVKVVCRGPDMP